MPGPESDTLIVSLSFYGMSTFEGPMIEVHISNVHKREAFRHHSYISLRADGVIAGLGTQGYRVALQRVAKLLDTGK